MPLFEFTNPDTGRVIQMERDQPPTEEELQNIFGQLPQPERRRDVPGISATFDVLRGEVEAGASLAGQAVLTPIAGLLGGVKSLTSGTEAGEQVIEDILGVVPPPGERGQEFIQSAAEILIPGATELIPEPVKRGAAFVGGLFEDLKNWTLENLGPAAATGVAISPDVAMEFIPGFSVFKKGKNLRVSIADDVIDNLDAQAKAKGIQTPADAMPAEIQSRDRIIEEIRLDDKKSLERIAGEIDPDPDILQAAKDLNIVVNPGATSQNVGFQQLEAALKSKPDSQLLKVDKKALDDLGERADQLIEDFGGQIDKSILDAGVKEDVLDVIEGLAKESDRAYAIVDSVVPVGALVTPKASQAYISKVMEKLNGDKTRLSKAERILLEWLEKPDKKPSYTAMDRIRKDVGKALNDNDGPFRGDNDFDLRQVYKVLSVDQGKAAKFHGVGGQYKLGRKLVEERNVLEKEAMFLFNREAVGSIIPKLKTAAGKLTRGDTSNFIRLIDAIPKGRRTEAVATMLNSFFTTSTSPGRSIGGGFVRAWEGLNRNPGAKKELFKHLPAGAEKRFDDIGLVSRGIFRSKALQNHSKTSNAILLAVDDGTLYERLYEKVGRSVLGPEAAAIAAGVPAGLATGARTIKNEIFNQPKTTRSDKADALLRSPELRNALDQAGLEKGRGENITKTRRFKEWFATQPTNIQAEIGAIGFIPYLTGSIDPRLSLELQEEQ